MAHREASQARSRGKSTRTAQRRPHDDDPPAADSPYAELIQTRVSKEAKAEIDRRRQPTGTTQAQWVRAVIYEALGLVPPPPPPVLGEPTKE